MGVRLVIGIECACRCCFLGSESMRSLKKWAKIAVVGLVVLMLSLDSAQACRWLRGRRCSSSCGSPVAACPNYGTYQSEGKGITQGPQKGWNDEGTGGGEGN